MGLKKLGFMALASLGTATTASAFDMPVLPAGEYKTVLFQQQPWATTMSDIYVNSANPPQCKQGGVQISQWWANPYTANGQDVPIGWNLGDFTGFYTSNNYAYQVGSTESQYGGSGIQVENGNIGWQIESSTSTPAGSPPTWISGMAANNPICDASGNYGTAHPFTNPNAILIYSYDLQVPYSNNMWGTVNTDSQMLYFIDQTANLGFWYSAANYSSVGQNEQIIYDLGTTSAIVGTFPGKSSLYASDVGNARTQSTNWSGYKTFSFALTAKNLRHAIAGLKQIAAQNPNSVFATYSRLSDDPANYYIGGSIVDAEVARVNNYEGGLGMSYKNVNMSVIFGNRGCSPWGTTLMWTCAAGQPNSSWIDAGGGCYQYDTQQACVDGD